MNRMTVLQDHYLNALRKEAIMVVIYLVNGFQIRGHIRAFDNFTVIVESEGRQQLIYKHAISTFVPSRPVMLYAETPAEPNTST